jgi:YidC/Oxa1 family membrane protein insertase
MDGIFWIYKQLVYDPLLNLLELFYEFTGDTGVAILLLSLIVNLAMWPLFAKSYINTQKSRIFQPKIKEIQEKYKDDPREMLKQMGEFNKKHGISNSSIFLVLFVQLFFVSGIFFLVKDVSGGKEIEGLYPWLFPNQEVSFGSTAFGGFLEIGKSSFNYIWLPILNGLISFAQGYYTFRLAPKIDIPKPKNKKSENSFLDPEALQKSLEFQSIYVFPVLIFGINLGFPVGLTFYSITVTFVGLVRQIFLTNYYAKHTNELIEDIAQSDPEPENEVVDAPEFANDPVPTKNLESKKKKKVKKKTSKTTSKTPKKK